MATSFSIDVSLGGLPAGTSASGVTLPSLSTAVRIVTEAVQQQWVAYAMGEPLPSGGTVKDRTGTYARSIKLRQTGDFSAEVYSDAEVAHGFEDGFPARDLKTMLWTSQKTRLNSRGQRYLIIPFRWSGGGKGGPMANVMPAAVTNWWKGQKASAVIGWTTRLSGSGHDVPQRIYNWGDRLEKSDMKRLGVRGGEAKRRMANMVNFRATKAGGGSSGGMTFRTLSQNSTGWVTKPKPGLHVAQQVAQQFQKVAEKEFAQAIEADIARILGK